MRLLPIVTPDTEDLFGVVFDLVDSVEEEEVFVQSGALKFGKEINFLEISENEDLLMDGIVRDDDRLFTPIKFDEIFYHNENDVLHSLTTGTLEGVKAYTGPIMMDRPVIFTLELPLAVFKQDAPGIVTFVGEIDIFSGEGQADIVLSEPCPGLEFVGYSLDVQRGASNRKTND